MDSDTGQLGKFKGQAQIVEEIKRKEELLVRCDRVPAASVGVLCCSCCSTAPLPTRFFGFCLLV